MMGTTFCDVHCILDIVRVNLPTPKARRGFSNRVFGLDRSCVDIVRTNTTHLTIDTRMGLPRRMRLAESYPNLVSIHLIMCPYNGVRAMQHIVTEAAQAFNMIKHLRITPAGGQSPHLFPYPIGFQNAVRTSSTLRSLEVMGCPLSGGADKFVVRSFRVDDVCDPNILADLLSPCMDKLLCRPEIACHVSEMDLLSSNVFQHEHWMVALGAPRMWGSLRRMRLDNMTDPSSSRSIARNIARIVRTNGIVSLALPSMSHADKLHKAWKAIERVGQWSVCELDVTYKGDDRHQTRTLSPDVLKNVRKASLRARNFSNVALLKHAADTLETLSLSVCHDDLTGMLFDASVVISPVIGNTVLPPSCAGGPPTRLCLPHVRHLHVTVDRGAWDSFHRIVSRLSLPNLRLFEVDGVPEWFVMSDPELSHLISSRTRCCIHDDPNAGVYGPADPRLVIGPNANLHLDDFLLNEEEDEDEEDEDAMSSVSSADSDFSIEL